MIISKYEQGSYEWLQEKIGVVSGTRVSGIITPAKLQLSKSSDDLILKLIDENITGLSAESFFTNEAMERGNELEPMAREEYEKQTGNKINQHGLCLADDNSLHGLSPDGFTSDLKGAVEIKCPGFKHLKYISEDYPKATIYNDYKTQCINYFLINEKLEWLDTVSYRPEFYPNPIHIERINRADILEDIEKVKTALDQFFINYQESFNKYTF